MKMESASDGRAAEGEYFFWTRFRLRKFSEPRNPPLNPVLGVQLLELNGFFAEAAALCSFRREWMFKKSSNPHLQSCS